MRAACSWLLCFAGLASLVAACGARTPTGGLPARADASAAASDADVEGGAIARPELAGHWMRRSIGNCINAEEWLELRPPAGLVETLVDRNYCSAHSVVRAEGALTLSPDRVVGWSFSRSGQQTSLTRTSAVVPMAPPAYVDPGVPPDDPTYAFGPRAFVPFAWSRVASGAFVRTDLEVRASAAPAAKTRRSVTSAVSLVPPPANAAPGTPCNLHVSIVAEVSWAADPAPKSVDLDIPCGYETDAASGWLEVLPRGTRADALSGYWHALLEEHGVFALGHTGDAIYSGFWPQLLVVPAQPDVLVTPRDWYREMLQPPPTSVK